MPKRSTIFANGEIYHLLNRSLDNSPILKNKSDLIRFIEAMKYYLSIDPPVKYSVYRKMKTNFIIDYTKTLIDILAYCIMPNHFHLLVIQNIDNGVPKYIQKLVSSFSHYYNIRNNRCGTLFQGSFKAIRIYNEEQLLHVTRYIHLNPVTAYIVKKPEDYSYSSYLSYISKTRDGFINKSYVIGNSTESQYKDFVLAQIDYQRKLDKIKHLLLEIPGS